MAQQQDTAGLAAVRQALDRMVADGAPGVLAELRDEGGTHRLARGVAELGTARPVDPGGWFRIGSVTKTYTATVVLHLVGEGSLGLDDPVERWLPGAVPGGAGITVRHLLTHTSGLYNYTNDLTVDGIVRDRHRRWTPEEVVARAVEHPPLFAPGTSRAYNNTGFVLLGLVVEKASRSPYGEAVRQRVLRPLGLDHTLVDDDTALLPEPHAHAYLPVHGEAVDLTASSPSQAGAAGGMVSTAADVNRFFAALLTGGLLRPAEQRELLTTMPTGTPGVDGALGLARYRLPDGTTVWGKDGGFHGYQTWSYHSPDASRQLTISATSAFNTRPTTPDLLASLAAAFTPAAR